ncbi:glycosyltransferase [Synechococcus sp. PCC 7336]|uniref:glycosyltransferase n=1 Tax=Synechococcus sp. PCC 7336 TaxID=195250 RepID=UPI0003473F95|nr:glycosyltransferase [Synechococcus sp. PCC 7336]
MGIIYINSSLANERGISEDKTISPFHYWGYKPKKDDLVLTGKRDRYSIKLRYLLKGVDLQIVLSVFVRLLKGDRIIYLISSPDLMLAIPAIKTLFPKAKIMTWVWTSHSIEQYPREFKLCDRLLCLTEDAFAKVSQIGLESMSEFKLLGADPDYYFRPVKESKYDVLVMGRSLRDSDVIVQALAQTEIEKSRIATTQISAKWLRLNPDDSSESLTFLDVDTHQSLVTLLNQTLVVWIPLLPDIKDPAGYTNLVEALLAGTSVVISDSNLIPQEIMALPGVYVCQVSSPKSLLEKTQTALEDYRQNPNYRAEIREAASRLLDGDRLRQTIHEFLS